MNNLKASHDQVLFLEITLNSIDNSLYTVIGEQNRRLLSVNLSKLEGKDILRDERFLNVFLILETPWETLPDDRKIWNKDGVSF